MENSGDFIATIYRPRDPFFRRIISKFDLVFFYNYIYVDILYGKIYSRK